MERPSRVDCTIAENCILDPAKSNAWQSVTDMPAACDCDAVPMRDDLHQRFPSDGQLLDLEVSGRSLEVSHQVTLREIARRQISHHKVPITQVIPPERLLIGEWVAVRQCHVHGLSPQMRHVKALPGRCFGDDTDIKLPPPHGRDEFGTAALAEPQLDPRAVTPKGPEELGQKAHGQRPEYADPKMPYSVRQRCCAVERRSDLPSSRGGLIQELFTDVRQVDASGMTAEQPGTDLILDIPDAPADRRLLDAQVLSRASEAAAFRSGDDVAHMAQLDLRSRHDGSP